MGVAQAFNGHGFLCVRYQAGGNFILKSHVETCLLSEIKKRPLLGGWFSVITQSVTRSLSVIDQCREVVRFSECPLSETRLYNYHALMNKV